MIESGKILQGRYKVDRQIGEGGMGAVYIATDERFGSTVAIKETHFLDEKFRKAFEREARLLNSLRHPALPRVSDHFIEGTGQFLVMEYIAGEDLSEQIEHEGHAFSIKDVLDWADQLLDALDYLHSQAMPVIHRDIKPQNLKRTPQGKVVLLDFGLAKGNVTNPDSATAAKSVFGYSRNYASLEQIQGTGTDPRSDLYSLAATLYHLLAGTPPVDALTRAMNVLSSKPDPSLPIAKVRPEVSQSVSDVLERAMSLNANERPASANEMRSMLAAAEKGELLAAPATFVERGPDTNLFNQKTQLQSGDVFASDPTNAKTETLSENVSRETKLRTEIRTGGGADADSGPVGEKPKRRGIAAGAIAGGLLLLGGAAGAAYFFGPGRSAQVPPANVNSQPVVAETSLTNQNSNIAAANANSNSNGGNLTTVAATPTPGQSPKPDVAVKEDPRPTQNSGDTARPETQVEVMPTPPQANPRGGDPNAGDRPPLPPPDGDIGPPPRDPRTNQVIPPDVWRKMTPLQRKRLRRAIEMQRDLQNRPDPNDNN